VSSSTYRTRPDKPKLRGVIHQWSSLVAIGAGLVLVAMAPNLRSAIAGGVFALSLVILLSVSAIYHRVNWQPAARAWMRRADHASIFVLIAGTYTPIALLGIGGEVGTRLFVYVWIGASAGVLISLFWSHAPKAITALLCIGLGWVLIPYLGVVKDRLTSAEMTLILIGGIGYTLGAIAYAAKRPNLIPGVFGYHELFHAGTIVGAVAHFVVVTQLVERAA